MRGLSRPRSATDKLIRAANFKVPANCSKLDSRDPITQFEALSANLKRIQMRLDKAIDNDHTTQVIVLLDIKGKTIENMQRVALEVAKYQAGAQAVSDRHHPRGQNASWLNPNCGIA